MSQYSIELYLNPYVAGTDLQAGFFLNEPFTYVTYMACSFSLKKALADTLQATGRVFIFNAGGTQPIANVLPNLNVTTGGLVSNLGNPFCTSYSPYVGHWRLPNINTMMFFIEPAIPVGTTVPADYTLYVSIMLEVDTSIPQE